MEYNEDLIFQTALKEMNSDQYEEAEKHFDMVALQNPNNWRAPFFRAYCKCHHGRVGDIPSQSELFEGAFQRALNEILKLPVEQQEGYLNLILSFLAKQTKYFIGNGNNVGGIFGSQTVGISVVSAANNMATKCLNAVRTRTNINEYNNQQFRDVQAVLETGKKASNKLVLLFIALGIISFLSIWVLPDLCI